MFKINYNQIENDVIRHNMVIVCTGICNRFTAHARNRRENVDQGENQSTYNYVAVIDKMELIC